MHGWLLSVAALLLATSAGDVAPGRPSRSPAGPPANQREVKAKKLDRLPSGLWGGEHIALEVTMKGAELEYDCAHGRIDVPIALDDDGRFRTRGVHVRERGGPTRQGDEGEVVDVTFSGQTDGQSLTLQVTLDSGETIGTFRLVLGAEPRVRKCG